MRENRVILWLVLAIIFIALLNLPDSVNQAARNAVREAAAPLQSAVTGFWRSIKEGASAFRGFGGLLRENERLAGQLAKLQSRAREAQVLIEENNDLRTQLAFSRRSTRELIACEVIAREQDGWWQTLRLNRGRDQGVNPGLAVVSVDGLVGKTIQCSANTADVLLISDPGCRVSVQVVRNGSFGVLSGRGPSWKGQAICRMEFINKNAPLAAGDEVVTSGLGGVFPKGLLLGYVDQVYQDRSGLYQYADVVAKADLGALQYAFVVRGEVGAEGVMTP